MSDFVQGIDYRYVVPEKEDARINIELLTGQFIGTIYKYGDIKVDERNGEVYFSFDYEIVETPLNKKDLSKNQDFKNLIGDIMVSIVTSQLPGEDNESQSVYIEEPDLQRGIFKEGSAFPKA